MRRKTQKRIVIPAFLALVSIQLFFLVSRSSAVDYPHSNNSQVQIQCSRCHDASQASTYPEWWSDQETYLCGQCHNSAADPGQDLVTHRTGTIIRAQCTLCHHPHNQQQNRIWGTASYLTSTTSDLVGGVTTTQVKKTGANWTPNQWQNMLVIPNVRYQKFIYKIKENTADTLTVDWVDAIPESKINITYCKSGNTFAIVWGKLIRENTNYRNVKFFRETGQNSFADGDAVIDGICQVCHTQTKYFKKDGSIIDQGHPQPAGSRCVDCHSHKEGFTAACNSCHGNPPINSDTMVKKDGSTPGQTGSLTAGAHTKHATTAGLNYSCSVCHGDNSGTGKHISGTWTITMGFSGRARDGVSPASSYNGQTVATYDTDNAVTTVTNTGTAGIGDLRCSNIYCHSTAQAADGSSGPTYKTPAWDGLGTMDCGSCHVNMSGGSATGSHTKHMTSVGAGVSGCSDCHLDAANDGTTYNSTLHVNYSVDVIAALNYSLGGAPGNGYGQCSTAACHSNGKGSYSSATWGQTSPGCTFCHPTLSGKHSSHVVFTNTSVYGSTLVSSTTGTYDFGCGNCHPIAVGNHMNGTVELSLNPADGGTLKFKNVSPTITGSGITTRCSGVYCHSDGQATPSFVQTPQWGSSFADANNTCGQCHGNSPASGAHTLHAVGIHFEDVYNGTAGKTAATGGTGSGAAHGDPAVSTTISCNICHAATLTKSRNKFGTACSGCHNADAASTAIVSADLTKTVHVNGTRNVSFAAIQIKSRPQLRDDITSVASLSTYWQRTNNYKAGATSYDQSRATLAATAGYAGGSCSTVACHNGFTVNWTDTVTCDGCHNNVPQ